MAGERAAVEGIVVPGNELGKERCQIAAKGEFLPAAQGLVRDEAFEALEPPRERLRLVAQPAIVFEQELQAALLGRIEHDHGGEPHCFVEYLGQLHQAGTAWRIADFRPGDNPIANLARALAPGWRLVLGGGETVTGQTDLLEPDRDSPGFYRHAPAFGRFG